MLPFCGYHMGDYWQHWLDMGEKLGDKAPRSSTSTGSAPTRTGSSSGRLRRNLQVLEWILKRCFGEADAVETPIGWEPRPEDIDLEDSGVELDTLRGPAGRGHRPLAGRGQGHPGVLPEVRRQSCPVSSRRSWISWMPGSTESSRWGIK